MKYLCVIFCILVYSICVGCSNSKEPDREAAASPTYGLSETPQNDTIQLLALNDTRGGCDVSETYSLRIYTPKCNSVSLCVGPQIPEKLQGRSFCCAAAYTNAGYAKDMSDLILGKHIINGGVHGKDIINGGVHGKDIGYTTGRFVSFDGRYKFTNNSDTTEMKKAAEHNGMAFGQDMMVYDGFVIKTTREREGMDRKSVYRALCSVNDTIKIIESKAPIDFILFQDLLTKVGANYALYLDMGSYDYAWYQDTDGEFHDLHNNHRSECKYSNFIVFEMKKNGKPILDHSK